MRRTTLLVLMLVLCGMAMAQVAPQRNFTDKLASDDKKIAEAWQKMAHTHNGSNYDLVYQRMNWNIDPDTLFISGEVTSHFKTTQSSVIEISFDMSAILVVDSILYHSTNLLYSQSAGDVLVIYLPSSLPVNQLDSVSVYYHGAPQGSGFGSFIQDVHNTVPVIWTLSEPFGAKDWWPCKNNLSDKIDSVDVYVTTPIQYRASSNGILVSETVNGSYKTAHWKHRYPIAAYLVAIAVTNYQDFSVYAHNGPDSIQILNYVFPETYTSALTNVLPVIQSMELYDSLFITYPFADERYGHTQFNWGGGMEHQTNTFLIYFDHELMAHELSHQWVGDMITCGNWHDIWLNEGFATYWTGLTYNYLFNGYYWPIWKKYQIENIVSQPDGSVYCYDTTSVNRIFDGRLTYQKGGMLLHMLRWVIGDSAFFAGMKNYLSDTNLAYGYACSDEFIAHMEATADTSLTEFFNDWLYGEGYPKYSISCLCAAASNDLSIIINQSQSNSSVSYFEMPIPLEFKDATHDTIIAFDNSYSGQQYTANVGFKPDSVKFDPERWLVAVLDTLIIDIPDFPSSETFTIFPNPVDDVLELSTGGGFLDDLKLYDIRGALVYILPQKNKTDKFFIDMREFQQGIYLLKATRGNNVITKKIVKE